jgi:hypothetical protein
MADSPQHAFSAVYERLAPDSKDLMGGDADSDVFAAFKNLREIAHPSRIAAIDEDYVGRGLLAHALFLSWRGYREAAFLLERARHHMMEQLRGGSTPGPDVYRLSEALTRFCDAWKRNEGAGES